MPIDRDYSYLDRFIEDRACVGPKTPLNEQEEIVPDGEMEVEGVQGQNKTKFKKRFKNKNELKSYMDRMKAEITSVKQINEENEDIVPKIENDQVGEFWVVVKPTQDSEMVDVLFKASIPRIMLQSRGGLSSSEIYGIYKDEQEAKQVAENLLNDGGK